MGGRHLPTVSYGHFLTQLPVTSGFNGHCTSGPIRYLPTLYQADFTVILAAQLSVRESHATRRIRFSVSDLFQKCTPGKAPPSRGRSVLKKDVSLLLPSSCLKFTIFVGDDNFDFCF